MNDIVAHQKTEVLNARVTPELAEWLRALAEREYEGNVSLALRRAIGDARLLEAARQDYRARRGATSDPKTGEAAAWRVLLGFDVEGAER